MVVQPMTRRDKCRNCSALKRAIDRYVIDVTNRHQSVQRLLVRERIRVQTYKNLVSDFIVRLNQLEKDKEERNEEVQEAMLRHLRENRELRAKLNLYELYMEKRDANV